MSRITKESLSAISDVHRAILEGGWDGEIESLQHALALRKKIMFRPGTKVRLHGTSNVTIDGKEGVVIRVHSTRISVGLGEATTDRWGTTYADGQYNVPPRMLEVIA